MTSIIFNKGKQELLNGNIDLIEDTIKLALMTSLYTPDIDDDEFFSDLSNESTGSGYTSGGKVLTGKSVSRDDVNNEAYFDADDLIWNTVTLSNMSAGVLYKETGDPDTNPLIAYIDFNDDFSKIGDDLTITWSANGILRMEGV